MDPDGGYCDQCMESPCHCDLRSGGGVALRLLPRDQTEELNPDNAAHPTRLVREYKGPTVTDLLTSEGARESLPELEASAATSGSVVPGPGFAGQGPAPLFRGWVSPRRIVLGTLALAVVVLVTSWALGPAP